LIVFQVYIIRAAACLLKYLTLSVHIKVGQLAVSQKSITAAFWINCRKRHLSEVT